MDTRKLLRSVIAFALGVLTKEMAVIFILAYVAHYVLEKRWKMAMKFASALMPYVLWQIFLLIWLNEPSFLNTQPFEFPLWGWLSGYFERPQAFLLLALVLVPMSYLPMFLLGLKASIDFLKNRNWHPYVLMILGHVAFMLVLPKLTAREPSAMVRITQGLMLAALLYGSVARSSRVLNYSVLWIATIVVVIKGSARTTIPHFE